MGIKEAAAREAVLKTLLDTVKAEYETARTRTQALLEEAAEESGTKQITAALPDGPDIATVSLSADTPEAKIADLGKFTDWAIANYPTEIDRRFVTEVRDSFRKLVLKQLTATGTTEWADPATGAIHDEIPGVELVRPVTRTHRVTFKTGGRDQVMAAWREGRLADSLTPQIVNTTSPAAGGDTTES